MKDKTKGKRNNIVTIETKDGIVCLNEVEFAIGWLHGLAEAHDLDAEQVFDAMTMPAIAEPKKSRKAA